jgi:hypothetical protein
MIEPQRYVALLTQDGTNDPSIEVFENSLGFTPPWVRDSQGLCVAIVQNNEFAGAVALINQPTQLLTDGNGATIQVDNANSISIHTGKVDGSGEPVDGVLFHTLVEIRIYPSTSISNEP